jgi:crossover junction endodeoxyribonuclease RuvC
MKTYIGIDPGLSGAVYAISADNSLIGVDDCPYDIVQKPFSSGKRKGQLRDVKKINIQRMVQVLKNYSPDDAIVYIESVHPRPGEGVVSVWSFASAYWTWLGILEALNFKVTIVTPQVWKKSFKEFKKLPKDKKSSITVAQALYPTADIKYKYHHGRADALLIASYGRSQECKV